MLILHSSLKKFKKEFAKSKKGEERGPWFIYTLPAIILPFVSSGTSNLLRALETCSGSPLRRKGTIDLWPRRRFPGRGLGSDYGK